jgi:CcmD family protein
MLSPKTLLIFLSLLVQNAFAQSNVEMADGLYSSGKIYIVVGVLMIIFIGIVVYLYQTDRKISNLEKEWNHRMNKESGK